MALEQLPLDKILTTENQPRKTFYQESLDELAASIKERGVLEPIVVRPVSGPGRNGKYEIVMGERRYRASRIAGLATIPCVVRVMSDEDAQTDALLENFQREDLNPVEKARAIQGLLQFLSWEKVGKTLGVSETTLRRSLELLELPPNVQAELVKRPGEGEGAFNEGHARALIALNHDPASQARLTIKVKQEKMNIPDLEKVVGAITQFPAKREAFLRVPVGVTDQMLKALGVREERKKPYRAQTAEQHLKNIDKTTTSLDELLDERIVEFLSAEQMNQLLARAATLGDVLESFSGKVRDALKTKEYGFREVYIHCPLCGRVELVGATRCSVCWTILRRCYDCGNYDRPFEKCAKTGAQVYVAEAESPKDYSKSYKCPDYKPKFEAQAQVNLKMAA